MEESMYTEISTTDDTNIDQTIMGDTGNNILNGGAGNDSIDGGAGLDTLIGNIGNDNYYVDSIFDVITENADEGVDTVYSRESYILSDNVENLTLVKDDTLATSRVSTLSDGTQIITYGAPELWKSLLDYKQGDNSQGYLGCCGIVSSENVLIQAGALDERQGYSYRTGVIDVPESNIIQYAIDNGLCITEGAATQKGGTYSSWQEGIVEGYGNVNISEDYYTLEEIADAVKNNKCVIVEVAAYTIWSGTPSGGINHAVTVTGVSYNMDRTIRGFYLCDSGNGSAMEYVSYDLMKSAFYYSEVYGTSFAKGNALVTDNSIKLQIGSQDGIGNALDNTITGTDANNLLNGKDGNDTLIAGAGKDTLLGGTGNDIYYIDNLDVVTENLNEGTDEVKISYSYTLGNNVENLTLLGTDIVNGTGNSLNNVLTGNSADNILDGKTGSDTMLGGVGNDVYYVDNAYDTITENANEGIDEVKSTTSHTLSSNVENITLLGTGSVNITGNSLDNILTGNTGSNIIDGGIGDDTMTGGIGNDTYFVDNANDVVTENSNEGIDTVKSSIDYILGNDFENLTLLGSDNLNAAGNVLNNTILGNSGNNIIDGKTGIDVMKGGAGNDTYYVDNIKDVIGENLNEGIDEIRATVSYTLSGNTEILTLLESDNIDGTGNSSNNTITGNSGNNILNGGTAADMMTGGVGDDIYYVDNTGDAVNENTDEGIDEVRSTTTHTLSSNVENITLLGTGSVNITGNSLDNILTGNTGSNIIDGGIGDDTMTGGIGNDTYFVDNTGDVVAENPSEGNDTVKSSINYTLGNDIESLTLLGTDNLSGTGNSLNNTILGNSGNNIIDGKAGIDVMKGGAGNDAYYVDNIKDSITENLNEGTDEIRATVSYTIGNYIENLTLIGTDIVNGTGNSLNNVLTGNLADNILDGKIGIDTMAGGAGNDVYYIDNINDVIIENLNKGIDEIRSTIAYTLGSNLENISLLGTGSIIAIGNSLNNTLTGNSGNNFIDGGAGNDTIDGGIGIDTMLGGLGNDTYFVDNTRDSITEKSNEGNDTVKSSINYTLGNEIENLTLLGADNLNATGNVLNNTILGNSGNNIIDGKAGIDVMKGGAGDDTYYVDDVKDAVGENLNEGNDTVKSSIDYTLGNNLENIILLGNDIVNGTGNSISNVIWGNSADNILDGKIGSDTMLGGAGNDVYYVDNAYDTITENANEGIDEVKSTTSHTLSDNVENITLLGTGSVNATGNSLDNTILGNSGNNTIDGGIGADIMTGGIGNDTYFVDNANDVVTENPNEGIDTVKSSIDYILGNDFENLTLLGSDNLNATGNSLNNAILGNSGNNIIDGSTGADTMIGGAGDDIYYVDCYGDVVVDYNNGGTDEVRIGFTSCILGYSFENLTLLGTRSIDGIGNSYNNVIVGNSGSNMLDGKGGVDTLTGGAGDDTYYVDNTGDVVNENLDEGFDEVLSTASYSLIDNIENLILQGTASVNAAGNSLNNAIFGNSGNNIIDGGIGADNMTGGTGNDTYYVDNINDVITENSNQGTDTVNSSIDYTLDSTLENLVLAGNAINGVGNELNNSITGNAVNNVLIGNLGNDVLNGLGGIDTMIGELGNDIYYVDNVDDTITEYSNEGTDLVYSSADYTLSANLENITLTGTDAISATGNVLNNYMVGNVLNNILIGGLGNDILNGSIGIDTMLGGLGNDNYYVDNIDDAITENSNEGTDLVNSSIDYILGDNLENLTLTGTTAISATGNELNNYIAGNIINNVLIGDLGNDILNGATGIDTMIGGLGNDTYYVDNINDVITENTNEGTDIINSGITYTLASNVENLTLTGTTSIDATGNEFNNTINGNSGNNIITGGLGADTIIGGAGNDTYMLGLNDGFDVITDVSGMLDIIQFGFDVIESNIALYMDRSKNLIIDYGTAMGCDIAKIQNQSVNTIEKLELSNGLYLTNVDINQLIQNITSFTSSNNIQVTSANDVRNNQDLMNLVIAAWHA